MAKIYGLFGSMQGKVADVVMAVRNGEQIVRKYQPIVSNPSTPAQIAARAKLKALSQLSAVVGNFIAIPSMGTVSSRNMFTKVNYGNVTYSDNTASIPLNSIKLTKSAVGLSPVSVTAGTESGINVSLVQGSENIDKVVYIFLAQDNNGSLQVRANSVVSVAGANNQFPTTLYFVGDINAKGAVLAYGIRDNNDAARTKYGNIESLNAETIAKLIVTRTLLESDVTITETQGVLFNHNS